VLVGLFRALRSSVRCVRKGSGSCMIESNSCGAAMSIFIPLLRMSLSGLVGHLLHEFCPSMSSPISSVYVVRLQHVTLALATRCSMAPTIGVQNVS
jgi:hypothetical protein